VVPRQVPCEPFRPVCHRAAPLTRFARASGDLLAQNLTLRSLVPEIGRPFGGRDHTRSCMPCASSEALVAGDGRTFLEVEVPQAAACRRVIADPLVSLLLARGAGG